MGQSFGRDFLTRGPVSHQWVTGQSLRGSRANKGLALKK